MKRFVEIDVARGIVINERRYTHRWFKRKWLVDLALVNI